jgi:DNA-damage-inducible protein D
MDNHLIPFEETEIRKIWHDEQWFFSVVDIVKVLTDSPKPRVYWGVIKNREPQLFTVCKQLKLVAQDGRSRLTDCANTEGVLRIVMSIPSPKAEPLKLWLAQVGNERIQETENPELAIERAKEIYKAKGYSDEWIASRLKSIEVRQQLTAEWQKRGINASKDYSFLTATIAKGTFGLSPSEHSQLKGLEKQNLRDHMTNLELIFSMLGEESTRMIAEKDNAQGFTDNYNAAIEGGTLTGKHREQLEKRTGQKVVSKDNFLHLKGGNTEELPDADKKI